MSIKKIITGLALLIFLSSGAANADVQDDRKAFIQKLITADVFQKIETPGSLPHLWVRPQFYSIDFDTKIASSMLYIPIIIQLIQTTKWSSYMTAYRVKKLARSTLYMVDLI